jgi:hypothetical protein
MTRSPYRRRLPRKLSVTQPIQRTSLRARGQAPQLAASRAWRRRQRPWSVPRGPSTAAVARFHASRQRSAAGGGRAQAGRFGAAPSPNTTSGPGNTTPAPSDTIPGGSVGGHGAPGRAGLSQAAKDAAARSAEAQNAVDGTVPNDFASAATAAGFNPRPDVTDPGAALTPAKNAQRLPRRAKAPAGDKTIRLWIAHSVTTPAGRHGRQR